MGRGFEKAPCAPNNDYADDQAEDWVDPSQSGFIDDKAADYNSERDEGIIGHMLEGGIDVQITFATGEKEHRGCAVNEDSDGGDGHDGRALNGFGSSKSLERFPGDASGGDEKEGRVEKGGEDGTGF